MEKNDILKQQSNFLFTNLKENLKDKNTLVDYNKAISKSLNDFVNMAFKPSFEANHSIKFDKDEQKRDLRHINLDLNIVNDSLNYINDTILNNFNDIQMFKTKCKNLLNKTRSNSSVLNFLNRNKSYIEFKDDFNSYDNIDLTKTSSSNINVSTAEGILLLPYVKDKTVSPSGVVINISDNASYGNYKVVEKIPYSDQYYFLSEINDRIKEEDCYDGNGNTWLEIQSYDIGEDKDGITCQLIFSVHTSDINWIEINPYIPFNSGYTFIVDKIEYRETESEAFKPLFVNKDNNEVGLSYATEIKNKYTQQGVYIFEPVYIHSFRVTLKQPNPYPESTGYFHYQYLNTGSSGNSSWVDKSRQWALNQISTIEDTTQEGYYAINSKEMIKKELRVNAATDRWCIGIKNIQCKNKAYTTSSEVYSIKYESSKPIKNLKLRTSEIIPNSLIGKDSITYHISFDDIEWHQIRPENHIGNSDIPYYFNFTDSVESDVAEFNGNIKYMNEKVYNVRLRINMTGVSGNSINKVSPILQEYALICEV